MPSTSDKKILTALLAKCSRFAGFTGLLLPNLPQSSRVFIHRRCFDKCSHQWILGRRVGYAISHLFSSTWVLGMRVGYAI
jgi:hypothetical protein